MRYFVAVLCLLVAASVAEAETIRWDIVSLQPPNLAAGGEASAKTEDGLRITITGSGTFRVDNPKFSGVNPGSIGVNSITSGPGRDPQDDDRNVFASRFDPGRVTGGGNWTLRDQGGKTIESGTYNVVLLVRYDPAPGTLAATINDQIGNTADAHGGLAVMEIQFSDKTRGILAVSCHLGGAPDYIFEGIVISKASGLFWNHEAPSGSPFVNANRTVFHVTK